MLTSVYGISIFFWDWRTGLPTQRWKCWTGSAALSRFATTGHMRFQLRRLAFSAAIRNYVSQALIRDKRWRNLALLAISKNRQRYNITARNMETLAELLVENGFQFVFIDCPAGIDIGFINAIAPAKASHEPPLSSHLQVTVPSFPCTHRSAAALQEAIIITTPEITSIRDADRVVRPVFINLFPYHPGFPPPCHSPPHPPAAIPQHTTPLSLSSSHTTVLMTYLCVLIVLSLPFPFKAGLLEANGIYNVKLVVNRVRPEMIANNDMMSVKDVQEMMGVPLLARAAAVLPPRSLCFCVAALHSHRPI